LPFAIFPANDLVGWIPSLDASEADFRFVAKHTTQ
jgi:hypothetical protein